MKERPPRPISKLDVDTSVSLEGANSLGAMKDLLRLTSTNELPTGCLDLRDNRSEVFVSSFFEFGEDSGFEEDLGETETIRMRIEL